MRRRRRFLVPNESGGAHPPVAIYHVVTRVVDRQFVLGAEEKEHLRRLLRMYERFSGCHILSYCLMSNHLHVLLEVPPGCAKGESLGLRDEELLHRLGGLYSRKVTAQVCGEIEAARALMAGTAPGMSDLPEAQQQVERERGAAELAAIHARYGYRMHSLSEFFKGVLQRFTCWFNRRRERKGVLWESRFRSVVVQDGLAARTVAAYIDLNPVRAGLVKDAADYRWSSYGEAIGGGRGARKAQQGLVRAMYAFGKKEVSERSWSQGGVGKAYRRILVKAGTEVEARQQEARQHAGSDGSSAGRVVRRGMSRKEAEAELARLSKEGAREVKIAKAISCRVRYFTDGAVIGSRSFVDGIFRASRESFGPKRQDGARRPRGALGELAGDLWSLRDLKIRAD